MSNVVAFKKAQDQKPLASGTGAAKSMTLFIHVKRATLIAHCGDLGGVKAEPQGCVGKSRI